MTPGQQRTFTRLTKQVQSFLDAIEADAGLAAVAPLAAAGQRGAHVLEARSGATPPVRRRS